MAAQPALDLTPIVKTLIPVFILVGIVSALANLLTPSRKRRRSRKEAAPTPSLGAALASYLRDALRPKPPSLKPSSFSAAFPDSGRDAEEEWSMDSLRQLEWKRVELLAAEFFKHLGFHANETRLGADGGVDVELRRPGETTLAAVAQCKAWNTRKVGVKPVRELFGVMAAGSVPAGIFVTTGEFTDEAKDFAQGKALELVDGSTLLAYIHQLPQEAQDRLAEVCFAGDYTTPSCPSCGVKMVMRTAQKGGNAGSQFWGCPNYPRCKQTFQVRADD